MGSSTTAASRKSKPTTFEDSPNAISSLASGSGACASASRAGQMIDLFGPAPAPVGPSASPASKQASKTRATFGRHGFASAASAGLTSSLVSNLTRRSRGSILFRITWKASATPSGRLLYVQRASGAPTSDIALGSWPTPTTPSGGQSVPPGTTVGGRRPDGSKATVTLEMVAQASAWPTPVAHSSSGGDSSTEAAIQRALSKERGSELRDFAHLAVGMQASPRATPAWRDYRTPNLESFASRGGEKKGEQLNNQVIHCGPALTGSSAEIAAGARLNPALARWLMRVPPVWCACAVTATPSTSRRSRTS